jgi:hypothetical protein
MSVLVLYSTVSKLLAFLILKGSTGADRHILKLNGFVTSSGLLRSASMELSPIQDGVCKIEIIVQKSRRRFSFFTLLTQLGPAPILTMVRLARHMATCLQFFIKMKMIMIVLIFVGFALAGG